MNPPVDTRITLAIPNKGRLAEPTRQLLERGGLRVQWGADRQLVATAWGGRVRILVVRAQDIPEFVADGAVDIGITGHDLVAESGRAVKELLDLGFGHCRLVLAVPERSPVRSVAQLPDGIALATTFPRATEAFLKRHGKAARIVPVSGAAEATPHLGIADAVADLTASGSTLAMNDLVPIADILASTARLVANPGVLGDAEKLALIEDIVFALRSVIAARGKRYLMMDAPVAALEEVRRLLPGIAGATIMDLAGNPDMKAVHVVVDEDAVHGIARRLKQLGCKGILVTPIDRMVA